MACDDDATRKASLRAAVLRHIAGHPDASDTLEGIQRCWLLISGTPDISRLLEEVLEELVRTEQMRRTPLPDGGVLYTALHQER